MQYIGPYLFAKLPSVMTEPEKKALVRVYSYHAEERLAESKNGKGLGRVLSKAEPSLEDIVAPWRVFYEPWESSGSEM